MLSTCHFITKQNHNDFLPQHPRLFFQFYVKEQQQQQQQANLLRYLLIDSIESNEN